MSADQFEEWDAAYLLGALSAEDRAAFDRHLADCADCRSRVDELARVPALLAHAPEAAFAVADPPAPDGLLFALQREVRRQRLSRRWIYGAVAAAAAAILVVTTALIAHNDSPAPARAQIVADRPMTNVSHAPLQVDAAVTSVAWGTRIDLRCQYGSSISADKDYQYGLVVVDKSGISHDAGSWAATPGRVTTFSGGTSLKTVDIASIEVTRLDGTPLLTLAP